MAKPNRLAELEQQLGDLNKVIPPLVNRTNQKTAGEHLGLSGATISKWLKDNRYVPRTTWTRIDEQVPKS